MDEAELNKLAELVAAKLQPEKAEAVPAGLEMISSGIVDGKFAVIVKSPSGRYHVGHVTGWVEVPNPKA